MYRCGGCGAALFDASTKYASGTGWPSFFQALPGAVTETNDYSIMFMPRTEVCDAQPAYTVQGSLTASSAWSHVR